MRSRATRARRSAVLLVLLAVLGVLAVLSGPLTALGGLTAQLGAGGAFQSATVQLSDSIGGTSCLSSPNSAGGIAANHGTCAATYPLGETLGSSSNATLESQGSIAAASANLSTSASCGVQQLQDSSETVFADGAYAGNDTGRVAGTVTTGVAGPEKFTDSPTAASVNGSTGNIETLRELAGPQTFTMAAWFKTSTAAGSVLSFSNKQSSASASNYDRQIYLDSSGYVHIYLYPGKAYELNSHEKGAGSFANGKWHQVVVTATAESEKTGTVLMYVDGALVAGAPGDETGISTSDPAQVFNGWWHIGAGHFGFLNGSVSDAAIFPTVLSAAQISALYAETTQSSYAALLLADSPSFFWSLQSTTLSGGGDAALPSGGATLGAAGPAKFAGSSGVSFNGTSGNAQTLARFATPGPQRFSSRSGSRPQPRPAARSSERAAARAQRRKRTTTGCCGSTPPGTWCSAPRRPASTS